MEEALDLSFDRLLMMMMMGAKTKKAMSSKCDTIVEKNVFKEFTKGERFGI